MRHKLLDRRNYQLDSLMKKCSCKVFIRASLVSLNKEEILKLNTHARKSQKVEKGVSKEGKTVRS